MKKAKYFFMSVVVIIGILSSHFVWADWYDRYRQRGYYGGYYHGGYGYYPKYYHRGYYDRGYHHRAYAHPQYFCNHCYRYHPVGWRHTYRHYH